jgi:hypothetical protein
MTALPAGAGRDADLVLVCDSCGDSVRSAQTAVRDFRVLWEAVTTQGWRGLDRAVGPHYCPACRRAADR